MPFTIDQERLDKQIAFDISKPQTAGQYPADALPVKSIPVLKFPLIVYKHPTQPCKKIEHRNAMHEIVDIEMVQAEALARSVENDDELKAALSEGWTQEIYIAPPLPDPNAKLYGKAKN